MPYSTENSFTGDGSTTDFTITFPFIEAGDIKARVDGTTTTAFSVTGTTISFTTAPANTKAIVVYRDTNIDKAKVTFQTGSSLRAQDLNALAKQLLYAIQEEEQNTGTEFDLATGDKNHITVNTANDWTIDNNTITKAMMTTDSVDSDQYVDLSVDLAHLSSESVDESKLRISNAGSNGEFLQKQSGNTGGLTWAAANNYSHPNHSGEVTSSADGATTIVDNIVDEANLKISNAGSNGDYLTKQSGNTGGLTWATPPTVGKLVKFATVNDNTARTFSDDTWTDSGLQIAFTPESSSSTILLNAHVDLWPKSKADSAATSWARWRWRFQCDGVTVGPEQFNRSGYGYQSTYMHYNTEKRWQWHFYREYTNSNGNAKTFKLQLYEQGDAVLEMNKDLDSSGVGTSYFTIQEIA